MVKSMANAPKSATGLGMEGPQESTRKLANEPHIYKEDAVKCKKHDSMPVIVMGVAGSSDSEDGDAGKNDNDAKHERTADGDHNSNTTEDDGQYDENKDVADGQVRIMWMDGSETTNCASEVTVVDRSFLPGDIVASAADPTCQLGTVIDASIMVDLLSHSGEVIKSISSRHLKRVREFSIGDYVIRGHWLGQVHDVLENVTVVFDDGSCEVMNADPLRLKPVSKGIIDDTNFPYHPGQRVRAVSSSVFKESRWLSGLWKSKHLEGTVSKVQTGSVYVHWIASANPDMKTEVGSGTVLSEEQNPNDLTLLSYCTHARWQLGDSCLYTPPQGNSLSPASQNSAMESIKKPIEKCTSKVGPGENDLVSVDEMGCTEICGADLCAIGQDDKSYQNDSSANLGPCALSDACSSSSSVLKEPKHESLSGYQKKHCKVFFGGENTLYKGDDISEGACFIVKTVTKVDVAWQDGTKQFSLDSTSLVLVVSPGVQDFYPEQYVMKKVSDESDDNPEEARQTGIIRSVDAKERTVCVRWLKPVSRPEEPWEFDNEEVVSAYELDEHPHYDYCYGDVVIRISPVSTHDYCHYGSTPPGNFAKEKEKTNSTNREVEIDRKDGHDASHVSINDMEVSVLSWFGHITDIQDGDIEVAWGDGTVSKVGPQAINLVIREDDDQAFDDSSGYSDDASWETTEENDVNARNSAGEESGVYSSINANTQREEYIKTLPQGDDQVQGGRLSIAIKFIARLASVIFTQGINRSNALDSNEKDRCDSESQENLELPENKVTEEESGSPKYDVVDGQGRHGSSAPAEECSCQAETSKVEAQAANAGHRVSGNFNTRDKSNGSGLERNGEGDESYSRKFKHFDITRDPIDHHFIDGNGQVGGGRKWAKKVQKEWSILEKNLPGAIFVIAFEDRMDLLRTVIIGACDTPYQDGLFFFDLHLPPDYPQVPPSTYYHSGGLRVNPNLYEDGKVCLSLLNTWTGKGNEVWDPSSSSILQVLVSIQGLVLNSRPYFNEPGYDKQIGTVEGERNSLAYNENTFLLNLKSMIYLIRRPPMHFEEFVKDHFQRRGHYILRACDAYIRGSVVGSLAKEVVVGSVAKEACLSDQSNKNSCSAGFRIMLAKVMPRLLSALSDMGADCHEFEHLRKL